MSTIKTTFISTFLIVVFLTLYNLNAKLNRNVEFYIPNILAFGLLTASNFKTLNRYYFIDIFVVGIFDYICISILFREAAYLPLPFVFINTNIQHALWISAVCFNHIYYFYWAMCVISISSLSYTTALSNIIYYNIDIYTLLYSFFIIFYALVVYTYKDKLFVPERGLAILVCLIISCLIDREGFMGEIEHFVKNISDVSDYNLYIRLIYIAAIFMIFKNYNSARFFGMIYNLQVCIISLLLFFVFKYDSILIWKYSEYQLRPYLMLLQFALLMLSTFFAIDNTDGKIIQPLIRLFCLV